MNSFSNMKRTMNFKIFGDFLLTFLLGLVAILTQVFFLESSTKECIAL